MRGFDLPSTGGQSQGLGPFDFISILARWNLVRSDQIASFGNTRPTQTQVHFIDNVQGFKEQRGQICET